MTSAPSTSTTGVPPRWLFHSVAAGAVFFLLGTYLLPATRITALWSVPFLLLGPGIAATLALWPNSAAPLVSNTWRRIAVSFLFGIFLLPGVALVLAQTPIGLTERSSAIVVTGVTVVLLTIGRARTPIVSSRPVPPRTRFGAWAPWALALLLVGTTAVAAVTIRSGQPSAQEFTEFYLLGTEGTAYQFPDQLEAGEPLIMTAHVRSHERQAYAYTLIVLDSQNNTERVLLQHEASLAPGDEHQYPLSILLEGNGRHKVVLQLTRAGEIEPYRETNLWIEVTE